MNLRLFFVKEVLTCVIFLSVLEQELDNVNNSTIK